MKPSTKKQLQKAVRTKKFHAMHSSMYANCDAYYIETYVNIKRVVKLNALDEERAGQRALAKEEDSNRWTSAGYEFVDSDFNIVEEKDYTSFRRRTDTLNTNCKKKKI
tara:strand:- start:4382 stop:4705 length:324 start_codon:yes stop_codon:yes gene_type:complete